MTIYRFFRIFYVNSGQSVFKHRRLHFSRDSWNLNYLWWDSFAVFATITWMENNPMPRSQRGCCYHIWSIGGVSIQKWNDPNNGRACYSQPGGHYHHSILTRVSARLINTDFICFVFKYILNFMQMTEFRTFLNSFTLLSSTACFWKDVWNVENRQGECACSCEGQCTQRG